MYRQMWHRSPIITVMAKKTGFVGEESAQSTLRSVRRELDSKRRERQIERNQRMNQGYWDSMPSSIRKEILTALRDDDTNKRKLARKVNYPHSFIMYIWENHL